MRNGHFSEIVKKPVTMPEYSYPFYDAHHAGMNCIKYTTVAL